MGIMNKAAKSIAARFEYYLKRCTHRCMVPNCKNHSNARVQLCYKGKRVGVLLLCAEHADRVIAELYDSGEIVKGTVTVNTTTEFDL